MRCSRFSICVLTIATIAAFVLGVGTSPIVRAQTADYTFTRIADSSDDAGVNPAGVICVGMNDSGTVVMQNSTNGLWPSHGAAPRVGVVAGDQSLPLDQQPGRRRSFCQPPRLDQESLNS